MKKPGETNGGVAVREMLASGMTVPEIAEKLSVSRQRVHQILQPFKEAAQLVLREAVRSGTAVKPATCDRCGRPGPVVGHQQDYSRPLEVRWLCRRCQRAVQHLPRGKT